jgi:hypothetical protein
VDYVDYLVVAAIGGLVGTGELVARYRDAPLRALNNPAALLYIGLNAAASVVALALIKAFGWNLGANGDDAIRWTRVLAAGFGAMALFRSYLFLIRVGDRDVGVGPNSFLQVALHAADRGVDRKRARARAEEVSEAMSAVAFEKASETLPAYCLALMQNPSQDEQQYLAGVVRSLQDLKSTSPPVKSLLLGLALLNVVGEATLVTAVKTLGDELRGQAQERAPEAPPKPSRAATAPNGLESPPPTRGVPGTSSPDSS